MKNVFIIHSYNGDTEQSFASSVKKICEENNIDYYFPKFPIREEATYEKWENVLNIYRDNGILNKGSIVIAHSLGAHFFPRYLSRNDVKINTYISVAGFLDYWGSDEIEKIVEKFLPSDEEFSKFKNLVHDIYSIYSDNDEMSSIENLEAYANVLSAKKILLRGYGHFNPKSNVTEVKEINHIILNN